MSNNKGKQLAKRSGSGIDRERYEPENLDGLMKYGETIVSASLCPSHIKTASDAVMIIQAGRELGLTTMQSLQNIQSIKGNITLSADMMKALCYDSGEVESWKYLTNTSKCVEVKVVRSNGDDYQTKWDMARAHSANLVSDSFVWKQYPAEMLRHRADAEAARALFPDVIAGVYDPVEFGRADLHHDSGEDIHTPQDDDDVVEVEYTETQPIESPNSSPESDTAEANELTARKRKMFGALKSATHLTPDDAGLVSANSPATADDIDRVKELYRKVEVEGYDLSAGLIEAYCDRRDVDPRGVYDYLNDHPAFTSEAIDAGLARHIIDGEPSGIADRVDAYAAGDVDSSEDGE